VSLGGGKNSVVVGVGGDNWWLGGRVHGGYSKLVSVKDTEESSE
jgi:hypothetical protein